MLSRLNRTGFILVVFSALSAFSAVKSRADDWVHWRGPEETGVARGQNLPDKFDVKEPGKNGLVWKVPIGGRNAPLVLKGRIYILGGYDQKLPTEGERVICLDEATGKTLWEQRFNVFLADIDSSRVGWTTLTADPEHERIFCHASSGTMFCFDRDGKIVWKHELTEEYGRVSGYGGRIVSPIFDSGLVIQGMLSASWGDFAPGRMRWVAFDGATGAVVWWADAMTPVKATHASGPVIASINGDRLLIAGGGDGYIHALHVRTGKLAWSYQLGNGPINPTPAVDGNMVYCAHGETNAAGQLGGVVCLDGSKMDPAHKGPIPKPKKVWEYSRSTRFGLSSVGYADGLVYMANDGGEMYCFDGKTGKNLWKENFGTVSRGAPLICDGKLYVFDVFGTLSVMTLDGDKKPKSVAEHLFKSQRPGVQMETHGTPIAVNGRLYFLTREDLYCIGAAKPTPGTGKYKSLAAETAFDPAAAPASIRIAQADVLTKAGATETFEVKFLDAAGRELKAPADAKVEWSLPAPPLPPNAKTGPPPLRGQLSGNNLTAQVVIDKPPQAPPTQQGTVQAKFGTLTAVARVRVAPEVGFKADFSKPALGAPPGGWVNAAAKFATAEYEGKRVLMKTNTNANPYVAKAITYITGPDAANYTIECDMVGVEVRGKLPDIGLVNCRYQIILDGKADPGLGKTTARLVTWEALPRLQVVIPYQWKSGTWYRVKLMVDATGSKGTIKGKVWERDQPEPEKWTLEMEDPSPNRNGAAAIYGYSSNVNAEGPGSPAYFNNLAVISNKK